MLSCVCVCSLQPIDTTLNHHARALVTCGRAHRLAYGIMFGIVAGMMVYIVIAHLLPGAHRYDPNDEYATMACGFGMLAMSASLMLFMA